MLPLVKDSENPFFKSKYADLHQVTEACYPALQNNGFSVIQSNFKEKEDAVLTVVTRLQHESGQWIETTCAIPAVKSDAHVYGSAYTYGRRYGLQAAVGLAPEDDDGNGATRSQEVESKPASKVFPPNQRVFNALNSDDGKPWHEVIVPKPLSRNGETLGAIASEGDAKFLEKAMDYIDEFSNPESLAFERLDTAIAEAYKVKEEQK